MCHTAENHHADGEDLFVFGERGHVAETDARHAGQREVERSGVSHASRRTSFPQRLHQRNTKQPIYCA